MPHANRLKPLVAKRWCLEAESPTEFAPKGPQQISPRASPWVTGREVPIALEGRYKSKPNISHFSARG